MAVSTTQRLFLILTISVCSAWAEREAAEKPACNCPQINGYIPHYGYQFPQYGYNVPKSGPNGPSSSDGKHDRDDFTYNMYWPQGFFMAHPYMYMMPQWPPMHMATLETLVEKLTHKYLDKHIQQLKGEKGDWGFTSPSGSPSTLTTPTPSTEPSHEQVSVTDNIQGDGQFGNNTKLTGVKVAFTVDMDRNVGPSSEPVTLKFNHATTNLGEGYNTETGQFVAPAPGVYVFSYHILTQYNSPTEVGLHHNDRYINSVHSRPTGGHTGASNSAVLALEKGDVITLVLSAGSYAVYGQTGHHTTFTGYLLYPE